MPHVSHLKHGVRRWISYVHCCPNCSTGTMLWTSHSGKTIAETWIKLFIGLKPLERFDPLDDGQWQELIDLMAIVTDEPANSISLSRIIYRAIALSGVHLQILTMLLTEKGEVHIRSTLTFLVWTWPDWASNSKLVADIDSARAVMSLWDVQDHQANNSPHVLIIFVRVVNNELSLTATFEVTICSVPGLPMQWDCVLCNNIFWMQLRRATTRMLNTQRMIWMGPLIIVSQSAHIWRLFWERWQADSTSVHQKSATTGLRDPSGNFTISVQDGKIVVEHTTPASGEVINCYQANQPVNFIDK